MINARFSKYFFSSVVAKAAPFILVPYLSYVVSVEEMGLLGFYMAVLSFASIYIGLRPEVYILRHNAGKQSGVDVTGPLTLLVLTLFFVSPLVYGVVIYIGGDWSPFHYFMLSLHCLVMGLAKISEASMQSLNKADNYAFFQLTLAFACLASIFFWLKFFGGVWYVKPMADITGFVFCVAYFGWLFPKYLKFSRSSKEIFKETSNTFRYLAPLTLHILGFSIINISDRFFINYSHGVSLLGIYTLLYSICMILSVFHDSVLKAWNPYFYANYKKVGSRKIRRYQWYYAIFSLLSGAVFSLAVSVYFRCFAPESYSVSNISIVLLSLAFSFEGARKIFCGYLYVAAKTSIVSSVTILCAALNLMLNYLLIPDYGVEGAALSTMIAFLVMFIFTVIASNQISRNVAYV